MSQHDRTCWDQIQDDGGADGPQQWYRGERALV
jgi:hypothetical protein